MAIMYTNRVKRLPPRTFHHLTLSLLSICIALANCPQDVARQAVYSDESVPSWSSVSVAIHMATRNPNASCWSPRLSLTPRTAKLLLLMVAGDVHPHPGPIQPRKRNRRRRPSHPECPRALCPKKVGYNEPAIMCDTCDKWWHARCGGLSDAQYAALETNTSSTWHCPACPDPPSNDSVPKVPPLRLKKNKGKWRVENATKSTAKSKAPQIEKKWTRRKPKRYPDSITTVITNANSLKGKKLELACLIDTHRPHILIITETKLYRNITSKEIFPDSYSVIRKDRNSKGGGVLIAISNELDGYEVDIKCESESVYVCLHSSNMPATLIGTIYRPPDRKKDYLSTALAELKRVISTTKPSHIIVGGDFNLPGVNWEEKRVPPRTPHKKQAKFLLSSMEDLNLHQMVHFPTRNDNTLDLLFTDTPDLINRAYSAPGLSDHETVIVDHQLKATINKKKPRNVTLYHRANWQEVKDRIKVFATDYFAANNITVRPINTNWSDIQRCITTCIADLIPHKSIGTRFHLPYITKPIQRKIRKRQRVYRKAKKSNRQKDRDQCYTLKKEIKQELNAAFNDYVNNMLNVEDDSPGAMKRFYRFIKSCRQDSFGVSTLKVNGKVAATS